MNGLRQSDKQTLSDQDNGIEKKVQGTNMSLSVGGYHGGVYPHPMTMGLASAQDYYSSVRYPPQSTGYQEYAVTNPEYFNPWVFNGMQDVRLSPDSYSTPVGTPSPTDMCTGQMGYERMDRWSGHVMTTEELALAHNIPLSEIGNYESYTDAFGDRCIRRRTTANRKERRRTLSINNAFSNLRCSIPNVPSDTKLSKIKTLRLAISYITYLNNILERGDSEVPEEGFKADISRKRGSKPTPKEETIKKLPDSCVSTVD